MCGRNYQGQLGLGDPNTFPQNERGHPFQPNFTAVTTLDKKKVIQVACGGEHSVMLCEDNDVFSVGANSRGQLGQGNLDGVNEPTLSKPLRKDGRHIKQIACGNNCTVILAGNHQPASLVRIIAQFMRKNPSLTTRLQSSPDLHNIISCEEIID